MILFVHCWFFFPCNKVSSQCSSKTPSYFLTTEIAIWLEVTMTVKWRSKAPHHIFDFKQNDQGLPQNMGDWKEGTLDAKWPWFVEKPSLFFCLPNPRLASHSQTRFFLVNCQNSDHSAKLDNFSPLKYTNTILLHLCKAMQLFDLQVRPIFLWYF